jgi:hypothetical protein
MVRGFAPSRTPVERSVPGEDSADYRLQQEENRPGMRTADLVLVELFSVRDQLHQSVARGNLQLAAECSFDLEQLRTELAALAGNSG